jgi:hypothetical protein
MSTQIICSARRRELEGYLAALQVLAVGPGVERVLDQGRQEEKGVLLIAVHRGQQEAGDLVEVEGVADLGGGQGVGATCETLEEVFDYW